MTTDDIHDHRDPILPGDDEREALATLQAFLESDGGNGLALVGSDGEQAPLPASVARYLRRGVRVLATQRAISTWPMALEIDAGTAARMLRIPLSAFYDMLDNGEMCWTQDGNLRHVRLSDVIEKEHALRRRRVEALDELVRLSEEMGLYDLDQP